MKKIIREKENLTKKEGEEIIANSIDTKTVLDIFDKNSKKVETHIFRTDDPNFNFLDFLESIEDIVVKKVGTYPWRKIIRGELILDTRENFFLEYMPMLSSNAQVYENKEPVYIMFKDIYLGINQLLGDGPPWLLFILAPKEFKLRIFRD